MSGTGSSSEICSKPTRAGPAADLNSHNPVHLFSSGGNYLVSTGLYCRLAKPVRRVTALLLRNFGPFGRVVGYHHYVPHFARSLKRVSARFPRIWPKSQSTSPPAAFSRKKSSSASTWAPPTPWWPTFTPKTASLAPSTTRAGAPSCRRWCIFRAGGETPSVGTDAKQYLLTDPENTIYSVKRLLGKSYQDLEPARRRPGLQGD